MKTVEEILGKVLNVDPKSLNDMSCPENVKEWDSFNGLLIMTEIEKNFNVEFSVEEVVSVKNIGDIKKILEKHKV